MNLAYLSKSTIDTKYIILKFHSCSVLTLYIEWQKIVCGQNRYKHFMLFIYQSSTTEYFRHSFSMNNFSVALLLHFSLHFLSITIILGWLVSFSMYPLQMKGSYYYCNRLVNYLKILLVLCFIMYSNHYWRKNEQT